MDKNEYLGPVFSDPRNDLPEDSFLWLQLLANAYRINYELFGVLHGLRCMGTRIIMGNTQYILRPTIDAHLGYATIQHYEKDRERWLVKWTIEIIELLKGLHSGNLSPQMSMHFESKD
jgi:hypothetical protein